MRIKTYPILGLFISMLFFSTLSAQETPSVVIENQTIIIGDIVEFDVLVTNYANIIGATFSVEWDSMLLRFVSVENIALGLSIDDSFGLTSVSGGKINYLYFDSSLEGNSLTDNAVLFTLRLEAIALEDVITNITFGEALEVVDITVEDLHADFVGAEVEIVQMVNATDLLGQSLFSAVVSPNPFNKNAVVQLDIPNTTELFWTLSEMNGQLIAEGKKQVVMGTQSIIIPNTLFKHTGSYILKLEIDGQSLSKRLIRIEQ